MGAGTTTKDEHTGNGREWDCEVDFLVVGSGASAMTAAIVAHDAGARTLVVEKSEFYGGSTALSGGAVWVPASHLLAAAGIRDSGEDALRYLSKITAGSATIEHLRQYVEQAPQMLRYLEEKSHVRFEPVLEYPDYYPEEDGGLRGGRSLEPAELDALVLGDAFELQRREPRDTFVMELMNIKVVEVHNLILGGWTMMRFLLRLFLRYALNFRARLARKYNTRLTLGGALAGRLRLSLLDRNVPLWLETPLRELIDDSGRIAGAVVERDGKLLRIRARKGVLLAAGGFEANAELRRRCQPAPIGNRWTVGAESNTGDVFAAAQDKGASLGLMDEAWWSPVFVLPGGHRPQTMIMEKGLPGSIIVNKSGARFMNEAAPYNDVVKAMYAANAEAPSIPSYFVFDATYRRKYSCGPVGPALWQPDWALPKGLRSQFITRGESLAELAARVGIEAAGLVRTVARYNELARKGVDEDFGRGASANDHYYSDPRVRPNPCMAPLDRAPFYAVEVWPGDLGTKGGLRIDASARVLDEAGNPIEGLYAAGNCSAAIMGRTYPGAGGTIGPGMTFGYIAARHATGS